MTRDEKRHLAGAVASAAAEMLGRRYEGPEYEEARQLVARWLRHLPGDEWDRRLPQPWLEDEDERIPD